MAADSVLFRAWRAGDERAGQRLFRRLQITLRTWFRHCPPDIVDDLVQETLVACVVARSRLRCDDAFIGYLRCVAWRVLLHHRYRAHTHEVFEEGIAGESLPRPSTDDLVDLHRMLEVCACPHVVIVALRHLVGLRGVEIARLMGVSEATVRRRLRRGLQELRRVAGDGALEGLRPSVD